MNWFDLTILVIVIAALIRGAISGLIMQLASLIGVILGVIFAGQLSNFVAPRIVQFIGTSPSIIGVLSYLISFLIILISVILIGKAIQAAVKAIKMNTFNRIAGSLFCILKWMLLVSVIVNLIVELDQKDQVIKKDIRNNSISYYIVLETARVAAPYLRFDWIKENIEKHKQN